MEIRRLGSGNRVVSCIKQAGGAGHEAATTGTRQAVKVKSRGLSTRSHAGGCTHVRRPAGLLLKSLRYQSKSDGSVTSFCSMSTRTRSEQKRRVAA
jgi:hypothetical protein